MVGVSAVATDVVNLFLLISQVELFLALYEHTYATNKAYFGSNKFVAIV